MKYPLLRQVDEGHAPLPKRRPMLTVPSLLKALLSSEFSSCAEKQTITAWFAGAQRYLVTTRVPLLTLFVEANQLIDLQSAPLLD